MDVLSMTLEKTNSRKYAKKLKRLTDIMLSCLGLIILFPLFILLPLLIKRESKGPAVHKRRVLGKDAVSFDAYKFRTMVKNADKLLEEDPTLNEAFLENFKLKKDPRITRIGFFLRKYSLDEIPQLINVLKGQMSLVGPRMMTNLELDQYGKSKMAILSVKPGITGLWQVSGRQDVSFQQRVELDLKYLSHWSLWMDLKILFRTIFVVVKAVGAY
jgi:lipopolysaccharide/colanic/teichoic acid biosynthesis glycosyltransferase